MSRDRPPSLLPHVKRVRSKGRDYLYFDTGTTKPSGATIYARLPDVTDPLFPGRYAALCAGRTKRGNVAALLTVPRLIDLYQRSPHWRGHADATRKVYTIYLDRLAKLLPTAPAGEVAPSDMRRLIDGMAGTTGAANMLLSATGALYKWARERGHTTAEPTKDIVPFDKRPHDAWPADVLAAALTSDDAIVRLLTHVLYYTGQRIGDVLRATWTDLSGDAWRLTQQKTGKSVVVPIHRNLRVALAQAKRYGPLVFSHAAGVLTSASARLVLKGFAANLGTRVTTHGLRKNFVNAQLEASCSVAEVAAITGHSLGMLEHYAKQRDQTKLGRAAMLKWERSA